MDSSSPAGKLVAALKQQLKVKGLHYRDVASRLKISERTVKRYFSGQGITLDVLQDLADVAETDVLTLLMLAQQESAFPAMTRSQQATLRKNISLLAVFFFLNFGMTPAQIASEFDLGHNIELILAKLEALGLIRRYGANRVKILAGREFGARVADHMTEQKIGSVRRFLAEIDLQDPNCQWLYQAIRLSRASAMRLEHMTRRFVLEVTAMSKNDIDLPASQTQWYRMFVAAEPTSRQKLLPNS